MRQNEIDPLLLLAALRSHAGKALKADSFSLSQRTAATELRFCYPMEFESVVAIALVSFQNCWLALPQESRKKRQALAKTRGGNRCQRSRRPG